MGETIAPMSDIPQDAVRGLCRAMPPLDLRWLARVSQDLPNAAPRKIMGRKIMDGIRGKFGEINVHSFGDAFALMPFALTTMPPRRAA